MSKSFSLALTSHKRLRKGIIEGGTCLYLMACQGTLSKLQVTLRAAFPHPALTLTRPLSGRTVRKDEKRPLPNEQSQNSWVPKIEEGESAESRDVFVDGEIREKRTLRKQLERMALSNEADESAAATMAARIRRGLQKEMRVAAKASEATESESHEKELQRKRKAANLRYQTRDLSKLRANVVAKILKERIIYDQGDIIALDKPYGLPVHGGPGMTHSIASLLPQLSRAINRGGNTSELHIIHRLDKETTGVMLLSRMEMTARILHEMFKKRQMVKRYWVITVGVPSPPEGIIDIPMAEQEVDGRRRMGVKPDIGDLFLDSQESVSGERRRMRRDRLDVKQAVTKYKVLSQSRGCALVELEPESGVKHQLRVHLAQGLGCPVLGDHKYSHHDKLAPQRLPSIALQSLGITQPKARTIPMHLHARQLVIPETFGGQNIFISTRAPWFFSHNMKKLRLKYDK